MLESSDALNQRLFRRAIDLALAYRRSIDQRPPRPVGDATSLQAGFDGPTPEVGDEPLAVIDALHMAAAPGLTGSAGSAFFGWVIGASDAVPVAADMLTSAWGQNAGAYFPAPAAAMAEKVATRWLLDMLSLPTECSVGLVTGATMANFVCLAAARNAVLGKVGWDVETAGLFGAPPVRVLIGADAHVTVYVALRYLGFGSHPTVVATDSEGRMDPAALATALANGKGPTIVIAQAGQINTGAIDPCEPIATHCRQHSAWLHVDGAFGLWALAVPEMRAQTAGLAAADSWSVDGHKWLQLPYDSGFAIVRDSAAHRRAMAVSASYLPPVSSAEYDPSQYVPELSRRARGFALWAQLRALGRQGIAAMVRGHCALARRLSERLSTEPGVTVLNNVTLNQLIVSFGTGSSAERSELTRATIARLQAENRVLAGGADWRGLWVLRISVISSPLREADIDRLSDAIIAAWRGVRND